MKYTVWQISFSFRIEKSFIGEILDCEVHSYACKIYVDSFRQILNENTDEVDVFDDDLQLLKPNFRKMLFSMMMLRF